VSEKVRGLGGYELNNQERNSVLGDELQICGLNISKIDMDENGEAICHDFPIPE
jgi:hypothetical protein